MAGRVRRAGELRARLRPDAYTHRVIDALKRHQIDVVAMAGFGTILAPDDLRRLSGPHPQHPSGPAAGVQGLARRARRPGRGRQGDRLHRAHRHRGRSTTGPILAQEAVRVEPGDTEATLHERIKSVERRLYPETIRLFSDNYEGGAAP